MAKTKIQKKEVLDSLKDIFTNATSVVFVGYDKLTVGEAVLTRKAMKAVGVQYRAVKKTLLSKVLTDSSFADTPLPGQIALAYGDDVLAPAREVFSAGKKFDGKLSILGGIFEKVLVGKERMMAIAAIPSREVLLGQLVNLINSPIQRLAVVLSEVAKKKTI